MEDKELRDPPRAHPSPRKGPPHPSPQMICHIPLNRQMTSDRQYRDGDPRPPEMKASARFVDGRLDPVVRNRMNMFSELGSPIRDSMRRKPPPVERPTRHTHAPHGYSTRWITQPPEDSPLAPEPGTQYATSYLAAPNSDQDLVRRNKHRESLEAAQRWNALRFDQTVRDADETIRRTDEKNLRDLRAQRKGWAAALERRNQRER